MISVYLDMDGVIADFRTAFFRLMGQHNDKLSFRETVLVHKIFRDLEWMPNAIQLIERLRKAEETASREWQC
jgi:hypothetical protein